MQYIKQKKKAAAQTEKQSCQVDQGGVKDGTGTVEKRYGSSDEGKG